jgi:hypothetical protein
MIPQTKLTERDDREIEGIPPERRAIAELPAKTGS